MCIQRQGSSALLIVAHLHIYLKLQTWRTLLFQVTTSGSRSIRLWLKSDKANLLAVRLSELLWDMKMVSLVSNNSWKKTRPEHNLLTTKVLWKALPGSCMKNPLRLLEMSTQSGIWSQSRSIYLRLFTFLWQFKSTYLNKTWTTPLDNFIWFIRGRSILYNPPKKELILSSFFSILFTVASFSIIPG